MEDLNILVPTDFTDVGNKAFQDANDYASIFNGMVTPIYVYEQRKEVSKLLDKSLSEVSPEVLAKIKIKLYEVARRYLDDSRINEPIVVQGNIATEVVDIASAFDLVIMGTNARDGLDRIMHSSVAKKVVSVCSKPVIVVTEKSEMTPIERILILTDFSLNSTRAFKDARLLMEKTSLKADLVHFVNVGPFTVGNNNDNIDKAKAELAKIKFKYFGGYEDRINDEVLITSVSSSEAITNLTFSRDYNLVFLSTLGHSNLRNLMLGSTASTVIRTIDTAVFVVNAQAVEQ